MADDFDTLLTTGRRDPGEPWRLYSLPSYDYDKTELSWTDQSELLVIVSHYDYDVSWVDKLKFPHLIYYKNQPDKEPFNAINKGKSEINLLKFIYQFYDYLPCNIVNVHQYEVKDYHEGSLVDMFNDDSFALRYKESKTDGYMCINRIHLGSVGQQIVKFVGSGFWNEVMMPYFDEIEKYGDFTLNKGACSQFVVSRERIQSLPREFYKRAYDWVINNTLDEVMPGNDGNKCRASLSTDFLYNSNYVVSRFFEWTWELIFTTHRGNRTYTVNGREMLCLYGARSLYRDVTRLVINNLCEGGKIVIPRFIKFNDLFSDPICGTVKQLVVIVDGIRHEVEEGRENDLVIIL